MGKLERVNDILEILQEMELVSYKLFRLHVTVWFEATKEKKQKIATLNELV